MKSRILNIVSSVCLISTLLFAQVAVNFFHNNHDVHQLKSISTPLKDGAAGVQKHDAHCKVCSIDFFNHAFVNSTVAFTDQLFCTSHKEQFSFSVTHVIVSCSQGRAPPVSLS